MRFQIKTNDKRLKPINVPHGFILIQDTREQLGLFDYSDGDGLVRGQLSVIRKALEDGDYSVKGFEDRICFERKMLSDFYGYIGRERETTTRKMEQFQNMVQKGGFVALLIEASESEILNGYDMSRVPPEVARQALVSFEIRYGVHVYCNPSRDALRRWLLDRAVKFYRIQREVRNEAQERCSNFH